MASQPSHGGSVLDSVIQRYLPGLQPRQKWNQTTPPLKVGQTVMVVDYQLPRASWPVGQVTQVFPSPDGQVRVAEVAIGEHKYQRPVSKLITLPELSAECP